MIKASLKKLIYLIIVLPFVGIAWFFDGLASNEDNLLLLRGNIEGNLYEVNINLSPVYFTWEDQLNYICFEVQWTWYTDKIWEIFFGYTIQSGPLSWESIKSYICSDGRRKWAAKIEAGGWIQFENTDLSLPSPTININLSADNVRRHSEDWFGNWTGYGYSDGIGSWNWNYVEYTGEDIREEFTKLVASSTDFVPFTTLKSLITGEFNILLQDANRVPLRWLLVQKILIDTWVYNRRDGDKQQPWGWLSGWKYFELNKKADISGYVHLSMFPILPRYPPDDGPLSFFVSYNTTQKLLQGSLHILPPFVYIFNLTDDDWNSKILIWDQDKLNFIISPLSNVASYSASWYIRISWQNLYEFTPQQDFNLSYNSTINVFPTDPFKVDEYIYLLWGIKGIFTTKNINGVTYKNIPFDQLLDTAEILRANKKVAYLQNSNNCSNVPANWADLCDISFSLFNDKNYIIPSLNFDIPSDKIYDQQLLQNTYYLATWRAHSFDTNETDWSIYTTGFEITAISWGLPSITLKSKKPVINGALSILLTNISGTTSDFYNWQQPDFRWILTGITFAPVVDIKFQWDRVLEWLVVNEQNQIDLVYQRLDDKVNIFDSEYNLVGQINWCTGCVFLEWEKLTWTYFGTKTVTIEVSWASQFDSITYYSWFYQYKIWTDIIKLVPNELLHWANLVIAWTRTILDIQWSINKAINIPVIKRVGMIYSSWIPFSTYSNTMKPLISQLTKGLTPQILNIDSVFDNIAPGTNFVKCENGAILALHAPDYQIVIDQPTTLILQNCRLLIDSNILSSGNLKIYNFSTKGDFFDRENSIWRDLPTNIYISSGVDTIQASMATDGSIFTLTGKYIDPDQIFIPQRWQNPFLKRQIYIKWRIISRNTLWGGFLDIDWKVTLPWGKKLAPDDNIFGIFKAEDVSQAFDINFWRSSLLNGTTYDTGNISPIILNKYNCQGDKNIDPSPCRTSIVIEE